MNSQTYFVSTKLATELEDDLKAKKNINRKWMVYLTFLSIMAISLVGVIIFFSVHLESSKNKEDGKPFFKNLNIVS